MNHSLNIWDRFHDRFNRAWSKHQERLRHLYRAAIMFTSEWLYARGVKRVYLGYP